MAHHDQSTSFNQSLQTQKVLDSKSPGRAGKNGETHRQDACATIQWIDPITLKNDPELDKLWPLEELQAPEEMALIDNVAEHGVLDPLKVSPDSRFVWDGRRRLRAARRFPDRVKTVPVMRCREGDREQVILDSLMHRRHLSVWARIYRTRDVWMPMLEEYRENRVKNLRKPLSKSEETSVPSGVTLSQLAEKLGINRKEFQRCQEVLKHFADQPEARAQWEPKLLSGKASFWNVLSGRAGEESTRKHAGLTPSEFRSKPFKQCFRAAKTLAVRVRDWESLSGADDKKCLEDLRALNRGKRRLNPDQWRTLADVSRNKLAKWFEKLAEEAEDEQ